ncbi:MAG: M55 family metallopeptidase [Kiritimatiellaeota bacterium]|nr:M55 family metallopeptidase [Kiritimatiellota bacterium]
MKKYMIRCDMEGVSGVVSYAEAEPGKPEYAFGQKMFMSDLTALIDGLNEGGADEILIYDEHYYGRNIAIDQLPENATAICGKPPYKKDWAGGLDKSCTGLILLGFHSKRNTGELLHHSYEPDIKNLILNGISVGEIGMEAAIAGDWGVPLLMITADSAGIAEARKLVPKVAGVSVKESLSADGGACPAAKLTARKIRETAAGIVRHPPAVKPWQITGGIKLEVVFNPGPYLNVFQKLFGCSDSIAIRGKTVTECWAKYWQMKLQTQQAIK